jgi:dolichol-phosphate mannosyltransferase
VMDGDLSHPPELVPAMLDLIESTDVDFVVGSRYIPGGGAPDWGFGRLMMSRLACALARGLTPVKDATSGFFLVRPSVVHGVRISAAGFKICLELLIRGRAQSVAEVPYEFTNRATGASKMNPREALGYLRQLWDLYLWWFTERRASDRRRRYRRVPPLTGQKTLIPAP